MTGYCPISHLTPSKDSLWALDCSNFLCLSSAVPPTNITSPSLPFQTGPFLRDIPGSGWLVPMSHVLFFSLWGAGTWVSFWKTLFGKKPADFDDYAKAMNSLIREKGHLSALGQMMRGSKKPCWDAAEEVKCPVLLVFGECLPILRRLSAV